ncbi:MAG: DMT family transporter [Cyclobacteriaceae bacterium]|nr:DMT family transporter [Cyclobacteriaceae bacterium]
MSQLRSNSYFIKGVLIALAGAICFSTKAIFVKLAYRDTEVDAITLLALRMIFSLPFFVISAFVSSSKSSNVRFTAGQWIQIAIIGCLGYYVSSLLDFLGLQYVTAGIERLILFIYPTLVLLMSAAIFKVKINRLQWIALIITYAGLMISFFGEINFHSSHNSNFMLGSLLIFICAFTYAAYIVGSGRLIPIVGASKFNSYAMSFAAAGVLLHFFFTSETSLLHLSGMTYGYSFLMAVLSTVIPSYLVAESIKRIGSDNAAIVGSVGPVSTILMAYFFLQEPVFLTQLIGTGLILTGVLLISRQKSKSQTLI